MSRTPILTAMLWTSAVAGAVGCDDPAPAIVDAAGIDGPGFDATTIDAAPPALTFASTLAMTAACGGAATDATLTITNVAAQPVTITALDLTGGFTLDVALPATIAGGADRTITVSPPAAVIGTDVGGATVTGTLTITADVGGALAPIDLTSTVIGANLALVDAAGQPQAAVALDTADASCPAPRAIFIHNGGNAPASLFASGASNFTVGGFTPSSDVAAGATVSTDLAVLTFGTCTASETVTYQVTGTVCSVTPLALAASFNIAGSSACFCS